jgi:hypothetical protein
MGESGMPRIISDELFQQLRSILLDIDAEQQLDLLCASIEVEETTGNYLSTGYDRVLERTWEEM